MCTQAKEPSAISNILHQQQQTTSIVESGDDSSHQNANNQIMSSPDREFDDNCASNYIIPHKAQPPRNNAHHQRFQSAGGGGGGGLGGALSIGDSAPSNNCDTMQERRMRQLRRQADWQWLHACIGKNILYFLYKSLISFSFVLYFYYILEFLMCFTSLNANLEKTRYVKTSF